VHQIGKMKNYKKGKKLELIGVSKREGTPN